MKLSKNATLAGGAIFVIAASIFIETMDTEPLPLSTSNTLELREALFLAGSVPPERDLAPAAGDTISYDWIAIGLLEELAGREFDSASDGLTAAAAAVSLDARHAAMLFAAQHADKSPGAMVIVKWAADPGWVPTLEDLQALRGLDARQWARDRVVVRLIRPLIPNLPEQTRCERRMAVFTAASTILMLLGAAALMWGIVCWVRWRRRQMAESRREKDPDVLATNPLAGLFATYIWFTAFFLATNLLLPEWLSFFSLSAPAVAMIVYVVTGTGGLAITTYFGRTPSERSWPEILGISSRLPGPPPPFRQTGPLSAAAGGYAMMWPVVIIATFLGGLMGDRGGTLDNPMALFLATEPDQVGRIMILVSTTILAPLFEEPLFRGFFYRRFRRILTPYGAAAASGFIFAAAHFSSSGFLQIWAIGFTLGLTYEQSGRLRSSMIAHAAWNLGTSAGLIAIFS